MYEYREAEAAKQAAPKFAQDVLAMTALLEADDGVTPEEALQLLFEMMDVDGGGTLSVEEVKIAMKKQGMKMTDNEIKGLFDAVDEDKSGEIDFDEFVQLMTTH